MGIRVFLILLLFVSESFGATTHTVVDTDTAQTLTNKTITSPSLTSTGTFTTLDIVTKGPWMDVRSFGPLSSTTPAVNYTIFQSAIDASWNSTTQKLIPIVVPPGDFPISSKLISLHPLYMVGSGGGTLIRQTTNNVDALYIAEAGAGIAGTTGAGRTHLENMFIAGGTGTGKGLVLDFIQYGYFENIHVIDSGGEAWDLKGVLFSSFINCQFGWGDLQGNPFNYVIAGNSGNGPGTGMLFEGTTSGSLKINSSGNSFFNLKGNSVSGHGIIFQFDTPNNSDASTNYFYGGQIANWGRIVGGSGDQTKFGVWNDNIKNTNNIFFGTLFENNTESSTTSVKDQGTETGFIGIRDLTANGIQFYGNGASLDKSYISTNFTTAAGSTNTTISRSKIIGYTVVSNSFNVLDSINGSGNFLEVRNSPLSNAGLTINRIPFSLANGVLADSSKITWDDTNGALKLSGLFAHQNTSYIGGNGEHLYLSAANGKTIDFIIDSTLVGGMSTNGLINPTHTPSSAGDTGVTGTVTWDASFIYICTATNTWKRVGIATW